MPFPASQQLLVDGLREAQSVAGAIRRRTNELRAVAEAGPLDRITLVRYMGQLTQAIDRWAAIAAVPGIVQYARDQFGDQGLDIAAEFSAMTTAATTMRDWLFAAFPKDAGSGAWLVFEFGQDGQPIPLQFTSGQLAGFVTRANTLTATIS